MSSRNEIDIVRKKVTGYLSEKKQLESDLQRSKSEVSGLKKELIDAGKEIEGLTDERRILLQEKENFQEAIKQFETIGKKDKDKINRMEGEIEGLKEDRAKMNKTIEDRNKLIEELKKSDS